MWAKVVSPERLTAPVIGVYAVRILLGVSVFVVLLLSLLSVQRDTDRAHDTSSVLVGALGVERTVSQAGAGLRGYLLTGRRLMLAPFTEAQRMLPGQLRTLTATARSAGGSREAVAIAADIEADVIRFGLPLSAPGMSLARSTTRQAALQFGLTATALQAQFNAFIERLVTLRSRRHAAVTDEVGKAIALAALGLALSLALDLAVLTFLLRGVLRPIRAVSRAAARFARGELDARVPDTGIGEVAMLAASFNRMAESSEVRTTELASAHERLARAATVAEEASRMKSTFLANMSHEVRTPLHGLLGMLALLGETSLDDDQRAYLDVAQSSSDALMRVVGDVLDIARIEAGRLEIEQLEFDLHETVRSVCGLMGLAAGDKRLSLRPSIDAGVPPLVIGDRTRVAQVLQNLVSNAVKFTPEGEVSVAVSVVSSDFGRIVVRFAVRDTGIGIEPAQLSRLFEPFVQAEPGTTRKFGGSGLGLAIARELTELMGGSIAAESVPGHGSTFSFDLPFVSAPARPAALPGSPGSAAVAGGERAPASGLPDEDAADENGRQARRGAAHDGPAVPGARRILVAEDHDVNWIVMERMLASRGHLAERAVDGEQVLEKVAAARYDLLLLDCQMPIRDGFETARELRRRELEAAAQCASEPAAAAGRAAGERRLPIVGITAGVIDAAYERYREAGMDDHLIKPISFAELDAILERWLAPVDALDPDRIEILRKLFPGSRLGPVLAEIQEEVEQDLGELDVAIGERDQARVAAAAHRIRNTAQLLGAGGLAARAAELDNPPRDDREPVELDDGTLVRLREQWASTRAALAELAGNPVRSFT